MKKKISESGNFGKLTSPEIEILRAYSPQFSNSVGNLITSFRNKGKNIDLPGAVAQLKQAGFNSPEVDKFMQSSALVAPMQNANTQQNPFQKRNSVPGTAPVVPPSATVNKGAMTDRNAPIRQRMQMAGKKPQVAPQVNQPAPTPFDQFEKIRTNPTMSNDDVFRQQNPQKMAAPITNRQQLKDKWSENPSKPNPWAPTQMANEALNPAKLKPIMDLLRKLQPEELIAIANMISSLGAAPGRQNSVSSFSSTTQLNAGKANIMNSKQKLMTEVLVNKIKEQKEASATAQKLVEGLSRKLNEGPLSNVWDKIKGAGTAMAQGMGMLPGQPSPADQQPGVDENSKRAAQEMQKILGKVNQFRSKFNSSILKNAESMNGYHDLVLNAVQMYQQYQNMLGPFGQQLAKQIHDAVGQLVYDLSSEKEQIDSFLKQLKDIGTEKSAKSLGNQARKRAEQARMAENPNAGITSNRRHMPGGSIDPALADSLTKSQAFDKMRAGDQAGGANDMQKLYLKQIAQEKAKRGSAPAKKSTKKAKKKVA